MVHLQLKSKDTRLLICSFFIGFFIRLIPEVLAYPYPISWDMVHYAYLIKTGTILDHWNTFFTSSWLLYALIFPIHNQFGVDSFLLLKITGPVLFGFNTVGVYWFAKSFLNWRTKKSFLAVGFFAVQLASLRISSEFLKNTLGFGLLLFTLPFIKRLDTQRGLGIFLLLSILTAFAHEYATVTLLMISLVIALSGLLNKGDENRTVLSKRLLVAMSPALIIFFAGVILRMFPISYEHSQVVGPNIIWINDVRHQTYGALFFFVNYLGMNTGLDVYPNYLFLVLSVLTLFALLYLPYFYLVKKGFFRNEVLDVWTCLMVIGSFGCLVTPFFALDFWHRWMFMLVYPFTFYAINGVAIFLNQIPKYQNKLVKLKMRNKVSVMLFVTALLGAIYLVTPFLMVHVGFGLYSLYPTSRYFSSAPAVPYQDINGTISAMQWLKNNMNANSCAVLQNAFATWARLYFNTSQDIIAYINDVNLAVDTAFQLNYQNIYLICWNKNIGWYGTYVPANFTEVQNFGRISVYEYDR